jgi:excisionase family DNA binding protein
MTYNLAASQPPEMLRVHVVARRLGCSPRTIRRLILNGKLAAQRLGQRPWVVLSTDIEHFRSRRDAA